MEKWRVSQTTFLFKKEAWDHQVTDPTETSAVIKSHRLANRMLESPDLWASVAHSESLRPHGLQHARLLHPQDSPGKNTEWVAILFSRGSSRLRDWTWVSCIAGRFFTTEPPGSCEKASWDPLWTSRWDKHQWFLE